MQLGTFYSLPIPFMFCVTKTYQDFGKNSKGDYIEMRLLLQCIFVLVLITVNQIK